MSNSQHPSRRHFLAAASVAAASTSFLPKLSSAADKSTKVNLASIGVGGKGKSDLSSISSHPNVNVLAICDTDANYLAAAQKLHPKAQPFADYREMLAKLGDQIDAVSVSTPDHTHAPASISAMNLGKPVYCQKPLTHDVHEARQMRLIAEKNNAITQMGIQVHSTSHYRTAVKTIRDGAIGRIKEVHSWSNKTWGYAGAAPKPGTPPDSLSWDLWLGTAPERDYSAGHYHPRNWRKWCDFGCGTMGDMGIHILDPVAGAVGLGLPLSVVSYSDPPPADSYGLKNKVEYTFAGTDLVTDGFQLTWYDGGWSPDSSSWPVQKLPSQGSMFVGESGYMLLPHVGAPQLLPEKEFADYEIPTQPSGNHYHLWVDAILGGAPTTAGFDYAGPLTEVLLLGVIANRFPTQKLNYDAKSAQITNFADANALIKRDYRKGFEVEGLG